MEVATSNENIGTNYTWNKIARDSKKLGFRDGAEKGREESFQQYFDQGFAMGFSTGFKLGRCKATIKTSATHSDVIRDESLHNLSRGCCCICKDNTLLNRSIDEIKRTQITSANTLFNRLHSTYSNNSSF